MARSRNRTAMTHHAIRLVTLAVLAIANFNLTADAETQSTRLENVEVSLHTAREQVRMVDRFELTLSVNAPANHTCAFPDVQDKLGNFKVIERSPITPQTPSEGRRSWKRTYLLEPGSPGSGEIPPLTVTLQDATAPSSRGAGKFSLDVSTKPFAIFVESALPEDADLTKPKDLAPLATLPATSTLPSASITALIALVLLAFAVVWWWWRHNRKLVDAGPPRPAHDVALEELQALENNRAAAHPEQFFQTLASILRRYAMRRFAVVAPRRTTQEFAHAMAATSGLDASSRDLAVDVLARCDTVKFACFAANDDDKRDALSSARAFIETTADAQCVVPTNQS